MKTHPAFWRFWKDAEGVGVGLVFVGSGIRRTVPGRISLSPERSILFNCFN